MARLLSTRRPGAASFLRDGAGVAARNFRTVGFVWLVFFVLSIVAVLPAWRWWNGAMALSLEADRMLEGVSLTVLKELGHYDRSPAGAIAAAGTAGAALLALLLNPLLAIGVIAVLAERAPGPVVPRLLAAGARRYWPSFRAMLYTALLGGLTLGILAGIGSGLVVMLVDRGAALEVLVLGAGQLIAVALVVGYFTAVLDVARIRLVLADSRAALAAVVRAIGFTLRHLPALTALGLVYGLLAAAIVAVFLWTRALTGSTWGGLAAALVLHQLAVLGRTWLRTALIGAELALVRARWPVPAVAPAIVPAPGPAAAFEPRVVPPQEPSRPAEPAAAPAGPLPGPIE